jgi:hypothetical protein
MLNNGDVEIEKLTLRHILSVRCPMCRAKPKEQCTLTTGHPSAKTHLARAQAAAKVSAPESSSHAAIRAVKDAGMRGLRLLFQHK